RFVVWGLVALAAGAATSWLVRRRSRAAVDHAAGHGLVDPSADPDRLEAGAARAEAEGDPAGAVRLRYEAGLLRLVRAGRLDLRPDTTAAGAAEQVDHPTMDHLTADFEEVVYGGRSATPDDVERSRSGWREVLRESVAAGVRA